jgi:protein involved in polysaccharide export with SLBB domain
MLRTLLGLILAVVLVPSAWAQSSYRIQAGDVLQMEVLEDPSLNRSLLVLPDGTVSLPLVGAISASGKSVDTMRSAIASALASEVRGTSDGLPVCRPAEPDHDRCRPGECRAGRIERTEQQSGVYLRCR